MTPKFSNSIKGFSLVLALLICIGVFSRSNSSSDPLRDYTLSELLDQCDILIHSLNYDEAEILAERARIIAESDSDKKGIVQALQKEATALLGKESNFNTNRRKASEILSTSLPLAEEQKDIDLLWQHISLLKFVAEQLGDENSILDYDERLYDLNKKMDADRAHLAQHQKAKLINNELKQIELHNQILQSRLNTLYDAHSEQDLLLALQGKTIDSIRYAQQLDSLKDAKEKIQKHDLQMQVDLHQSRQFLFLAFGVIALILLIGLFMRYRDTRNHSRELASKNEAISSEREKSENLLLNILPKTVASELKAQGAAKSRKYETATVFFSDFVNFTSISALLSPENLVSLLDNYFKTFDEIIDKHGLEKIKTIGDAYMCVGGLPEEMEGHACAVVQASLEIQEVLHQMNQKKKEEEKPFFEARIGVHSGPLIAGVVGKKKFAFDVWGDTVNVASRLESVSEPGKVNISDTTYDFIKDQFSCTSRGKIPVKNRGEIQMYFVDQKS